MKKREKIKSHKGGGTAKIPTSQHDLEKQQDQCGHHSVWQYCPGCGIDWEDDGDSFGCWSCGFVKKQIKKKQKKA